MGTNRCAWPNHSACLIADGHPDPPLITPTAKPEAEVADVDYDKSGRGIAIIVALATDFGWRRRDDDAGKVMWFTLNLGATEP